MALFVKQKKVNSRARILFSLLASLIAHQSCQSLYIALEGCNRKKFHRLIFNERKFLIFGWQRTPIFKLAYLCHLCPTERSGIWRCEFTVLVWQIRSVVVSMRLEPEIRDTLHVLAGFYFSLALQRSAKVKFPFVGEKRLVGKQRLLWFTKSLHLFWSKPNISTRSAIWEIPVIKLILK